MRSFFVDICTETGSKSFVRANTNPVLVTKLIVFLVLGVSGFASAQTDDSSVKSAQSTTVQTVGSTNAERRALDDAYAQWKQRYAKNRAWVATEIKAIKQELAELRQTRPEQAAPITDLLNGSIQTWNREKTDYGDPEQFTECQEVLATVRESIRKAKQ